MRKSPWRIRVGSCASRHRLLGMALLVAAAVAFGQCSTGGGGGGAFDVVSFSVSNADMPT